MTDVQQDAEANIENTRLRAAVQKLLDNEARLEAQCAIASALRGRKAALAELREIMNER